MPIAPVTQIVNLTGYGVELALKKTEYKTGDTNEHDNQKPAQKKQTRSYNGLSEVIELHPMVDYTNVGLRATSSILSSAHPLDALSNLSGAFPVFGSRSFDLFCFYVCFNYTGILLTLDSAKECWKVKKG